MQLKAKIASGAGTAGFGGAGFAVNSLWPDFLPQFAVAIGIGSAVLLLISAFVWARICLIWWREKNPKGHGAMLSAPQPVTYDKIKAWDVIWSRYKVLSKSSSHDETLLSQAVADFRLAAKVGAITVWGRQRRSATFEKIDPLFWETGGIDTLASMKQSGEGGVATTMNAFLEGAKEYVGVRTLKTDVEKIWPDLAQAKGFEYR